MSIESRALRAVTCALLLSIFLFTFSVPTSAQAEDHRIKSDEWREDLDFLASELKDRHANLFHSVCEDEFETVVERLEKRIPSLSPREIIIEMARLVAMAEDGHTRLNLPREGRWAFRRFPVRLYMYQEGLFIQAAAKEYTRAVGGRVIKIGGLTLEQALKRISPVIHHDNEMTTKLLLPYFVSTPEVLHVLGITGSSDKASFVVEQRDGKRVAIELFPQKAGSEIEWVDSRDKNSDTPLWLTDNQNNYWFKYLEGSSTVYVQLNAINDKQGERISAFADRLCSFIASNPVEKLILDIRLNDGGNSRLAQDLLHALIRSDKINQPGKLFIIIGRATFSAAVVFAAELERHTNAIFVGEPTGGQPNQYGEMLTFTLPNSGLPVSYSAYYFQTAGPFDNRKWIAPAIAADLSAEDYRLNRDPAFEAAMNYVASRPLSEALLQAALSEGVQAAIKHYDGFRNAPANKYVDTEDQLRRLGNRLLEMKRVEDAILIYKLNVNTYPNRARPYYSLGEAYLAKGDKDGAAVLYRKGLALVQRDQSIHKGLKDRLRQLAKERVEQSSIRE